MKTSALFATLRNIKTATPLQVEEWDFRALMLSRPTREQRNELHAAVYYEYARESESLRTLAEKSATMTAAQRAYMVDPWLKIEVFKHFPFWNCIFWPNVFPATPWLKIAKSHRTARIQEYFDMTPPRSLLRINDQDDIRKWQIPERSRRLWIGGEENLFIQILWSAGNNADIIEAFANWVRSSRPPEYPEPRGDASRLNVSKAFLTRLAVMRLLHNYTHSDALRLAKDNGLPMPQQQSNALRMRKQVKADLRRLFLADKFKASRTPLIPDEECPLRWSTLTERRKARP